MRMSFEEIQKRIEYMPKDIALQIRNAYINKFINTESEYYKKSVEVVTEFSDGRCYTGYLWDCMNNPIVIKFEDVAGYKEKLNDVMIFWDIHSKERIWVENYWKFGKDSVLKLKFADFLDNLDLFPEDIYVFDDTMKWTLVLTHEDNDGIRICAKFGNI